MATALDSIKRALRLIGVYSIGEEPSDDEAQDGLTALNAMLESLSNDKKVIYASTLDVISWAASTPSYTIGPSGTVVTDRPITVLNSSYFVYGGVSYPLVPVTVDEYNSIPLKTINSTVPQYAWYQPTYPNGTLTLFPIPSTAIQVYLWSNKELLNIPTLTTQIDLPPGYRDFVDFNLAERLAPEFEVPVPAEVAKQAMLTRKAIARVNFVPQYMHYPTATLPQNGRFNIYTGQPL